MALLLLLPAPAAAEDPPRTDPEIGTPSEEIYGIPLEEARRDAAPRILPEAAIRTEMGVGSSAHVPGRGPDPRGKGSAGDPERRAERQRKRRRQAALAATRLSGDPSPAATTLLLVLVVGIASAGGVAAGRLIGRRARL